MATASRPEKRGKLSKLDLFRKKCKRDLCSPVSVMNSSPPEPPEIQSISNAKLINNLNDNQLKYCSHVLRSLHLKRPFYEFVTGNAGTGKSELIRALHQVCSDFFNLEFANMPRNPNQPFVLLSAPTGKAAYNIGGRTLHSLFRLPLQDSEDPLKPIKETSYPVPYVENAKLLIIDEISMLGANLFHALDMRMRQIYGQDEWFGGLSVICVGDLNQLEPVKDKYIFEKGDAQSDVWSNFGIYALTEPMRQARDLVFMNALNRMALGALTPDDVELLSSREIKHSESADASPDSAIHLFYRNAHVDQFNAEKMQALPGETVFGHANDTIVLEGNETAALSSQLDKMKERMLKRNFRGLSPKIAFKIGVKYLLTANLDTSSGLFNGAIGTLKHIEYRDQTLSKLWVDFDQPSHVLQTKVAPISHLTKSGLVGLFTITRSQFPLVPAEAITIHKSQGSTFSSVVLHSSYIPWSALYVACSRVRLSTDLFIDGTFRAPYMSDTQKKIKTHVDKMFRERQLVLDSNPE